MAPTSNGVDKLTNCGCDEVTENTLLILPDFPRKALTSPHVNFGGATDTNTHNITR